MNIWTVLKSLLKKNYLKKKICSFIQDRKIGDDGKISDGHIDVNDYLTCKKTWNKFEMKNMGDYHDHYLYLKKRCIIISLCL